MAEDDAFGNDPSNPFPVAPDPFFEPTKAKQKAATKKAVKAADPDTKALGKGFDPNAEPAPSNDSLDIGDIGGKDYKFKAVTTNPEGDIKDYRSTDPGANITDGESGPVEGDPKTSLTRQLEMVLGGTQASSDVSPHEYRQLTAEAAKGNKLAQQILVKGKFKAQDYPSEAQDLKKVEDPFVNALSGLPALAQNEQAQANKVTQPYDFSNAEAQVNNLLGQMGSSQQMSTSPETNSYLSGLQGIVSQGANNLTSGVPALGIPSIQSALEGLGPAAKTSEKVSPYASLLAALLAHQQYEITYEGANPGASSDPGWLQNLLQQVTGTAITGGLVSPTTAAGGVGSVPSTSASPTGSNA